MPLGNEIVLGAIVFAFVTFMAVLAVTAWWSSRGPQPVATAAHEGAPMQHWDKAA